MVPRAGNERAWSGRVMGSLALTVKLGRLPVALLLLLLEQFEASAGAGQEQPEALAQRMGEQLSGQVLPPCRKPQTQEGSESRGQTAHGSPPQSLPPATKDCLHLPESSKLVHTCRPLSITFSFPRSPSPLCTPGNSTTGH